MKKELILIVIAILLSACQSDADRLVFDHQGIAVLQNGQLCIGGTKRDDVLSYYYLADVNGGLNKKLIASGYYPVKLTYPGNCFSVNLEPSKHYGILYIMNDIKYRFEFNTFSDGTIKPTKKRDLTMSLPAYLFLYDNNGRLVSSTGTLTGSEEERENGIEIMSSQHGVFQPADGNTGRLTGTRQHHAFTLHKQLDKTSPLLNNAVCTGQAFSKAVVKYFEIMEAGIETEIYRITMERVVVTSVNCETRM